MKIPNLLRYNRRTINNMTNEFTLNNFFEINNELGVIIITPKQVAFTHRKMEQGLIHDTIIKKMRRILKIKKNEPIIAMRCYSYSNKVGGCVPLSIGDKKITQDMYDIVDKIYERVTAISGNIIGSTAKELVEIGNLEICNYNIENERIVGIQLDEFMKRLDLKDTIKKDNKLREYKIDNSKNQIEEEALKEQKETNIQEVDSSIENRHSLE